jgi:hypothetical protein
MNRSEFEIAISLTNEAIKAANKYGIHHPATKKLNLMAKDAYRQIQEKMAK